LNASHPAIGHFFHILERNVGLFEEELGEPWVNDERLFFVPEIHRASAKERTGEAPVEEVFVWIGENGGVRNKEGVGNTCEGGKLEMNELG